ncbi:MULTISPECIES: transposase [Oscillatoriales]|uniref:transposase n=1 Tax=Oscillatoriophycideae TaxID=1301283 RepID=UPI001F55196E|nr:MULTISPECIES: transposase [Oscillatoriales]
MLKLWSEQGIIRLKYADESGFERTSNIGYSYIRRGEQQHIHQPRRRGKRLSALGFLQPKKSFEYGLVVGGFNSERYVKLMDWQAEKAATHLEKTGQITVIIQDGASFHQSKSVKQHWQRWQSMGLYLFFLPPYSPQMNRIEDEWLHLKRDELSSRVFEDEYLLAMALIAGIESRAFRCGYEVERFKFS